MIEEQTQAAAPARAAVVMTLIDGTVVDDCDHRWLAECLQRQKHIDSMRVRDRIARGEYLGGVERKEGLEAARRLAAAYVTDWQRRKDAADAVLKAAQSAQSSLAGLA